MSLTIHNLAVYSLQVAVLVAIGALLPLIFRLPSARARLVYWHGLLAACLLLPVLQPWKQVFVDANVQITSRTIAMAPRTGSTTPAISLEQAIWLLLGAGILLRLLWLALGFRRLRRYRTRARLLYPPPAALEELMARLGTQASLALSDEVAGPVTFGVRHPVILFPARFAGMEPGYQEAVACHELLHVRRKDWAFTVCEEVIRALVWFHPAIWWLLGEIQLTREQAVDREVVRLTQARERYVEALVAIAARAPMADLAPAPLFLRKRHLTQRVAEILKEVSMSRKRLMVSLATIGGVLLATGWITVRWFPLEAAPQDKTATAPDAPGVAVEQGALKLLHRAPVAYPEAAREKGVQGSVVLELDVDENGIVSDARVLNGPQELRRAALQSALQWHFSKDQSLPAKAQVTINFTLPAGPQGAAVPRPVVGGVVGGVPGGVVGGIAAARPQSPGVLLKQIDLDSLPDPLREELKGKLAEFEGQQLSIDQMRQVTALVMGVDRHLLLTWTPESLRVTLQGEAPSGVPGGGPMRIRVGGNVQQNNLIQHTRPIYPPLAKQARIQGTVRLNAVIGKDGTVQNLTVISGHPLLVPPAMEAVKTWVYKPTLLNGNPVEVVTQIDVNFTLSE